ncbi:GNAT family N-acetyltransferase, partial [Nocardia wallacei]|uniref:GNAT family N-acetyltransferase n=1 Tax=Nocardia wallacei TaxID=480035 RepID=UPI00313CBB29
PPRGAPNNTPTPGPPPPPGGGGRGPAPPPPAPTARHGGYTGVWLGVNQDNERAQRFYAKHGFRTIGTKTTAVGSRTCHDYVLHKEL